jgi:hypothetical protein
VPATRFLHPLHSKESSAQLQRADTCSKKTEIAIPVTVIIIISIIIIIIIIIISTKFLLLNKKILMTIVAFSFVLAFPLS